MGAGVGAGVGVFAGGVGAVPGAVVGAKAGAIGGFISGFIGGVLADPNESTLETIKSGAIEGVIGGALGGAGGVIAKARHLNKLSRLSVEDKLARYLLNPNHPVGGAKAKWFEKALGFTSKNADDLAKQLKFNPKNAVQTAVAEHGTKFNQVIEITGANGKVIPVTTSWIKRTGEDFARLVTAIPTPK